MTKRYVKKPIEITAVQWDGENLGEVVEFLRGHPLAACWGFENAPWNTETLTIPTLEGPMRVDVGSYIIRGVEGEYYPCKKEIFEKTYWEVPDDDEQS